MYWTNLEGVKTELTSSGFADAVALKYFLAFTVWAAITLSAFGWSPLDLKAHPFFLALHIFVNVAPIVGTYVVLFRIVPKDKGFRLLPSYFAVGWVVNIRTALILSPMFFLSLYWSRPTSEFPAVGYLLSLVAPLIYYVIFYNKVTQVLKRLSAVVP